ncbi:hypothetical protein [Pseudomonas sp.]|uniref:phage tail tube protein n=1 Tax=Pseudomonas sp. TaxID=306 RepID=UPI0026283659|nr:hypothetical protein [Pseudomonas sp.]
MTTPAEIKPTQGVSESSYAWILEVGLLPTTPGGPIDWHTIPDQTAMQPNSTPTQTDGGTYAHKGQAAQDTIGESFVLNTNVKVITDAAGEVIPGVEILIAAANALLSDDLASSRVIAVRFYHYRIASLAYEFTADVTWTRANTGNTDNEFLSITLTAKGDRKSIANPALSDVGVVPGIDTATPEGVAEGGLVRLDGANLRHVTVVKVDTATAEFVKANGALYVTMPAGSPGPASIVVETAQEAGPAFSYTRG